MRLVLLPALAMLVLCTAASAHPSGGVVGSGGGTMSGGGLVLHGTAGQPAAGLAAGALHRTCHGFWCFGASRVLDVTPPAGGPDAPAALAFGPPSPSPSRGEVAFALALPGDATVKLSVYDVAGRAVGEPLELELRAGQHQLRWRSADDRPGVFFGVLEVNGALRATHRIVLVR